MKNLVCDLQMAMVITEEKKKCLTARLKDGVKQLDLNLARLRKIDSKCSELQEKLEKLIRQNIEKNGQLEKNVQPRKMSKPTTAKKTIPVLDKRAPKKI